MSKQSKGITNIADALKYAVGVISNISILTVFRVTLFLMVLCLVIFSANVALNKTAVERIVDHMVSEEQSEKAAMDIRDNVSPKIQGSLTRMLYKNNGDRAFVIELHNGKKNATALPFKYYDMTYEEVNEERHVKNVSQHFTNVMVTHYKLPYYLVDEKIFVGNADELEEIDPRWADNFREHGGNVVGITILRSSGEDVGFLGISYDVGTTVPPYTQIKSELEQYAKVIAPLLDLGMQRIVIAYNKNSYRVAD